MAGSSNRTPLDRVNERLKKLTALCTEMNDDIGGAYEEIEELRNDSAERFKAIDRKLEMVGSHETRIRWLERKIEKRGRPPSK